MLSRDAKLAGLDEEAALLKAAEQFGIEEVAPELQAVHLEWESAMRFCWLPCRSCALMLRWTVFFGRRQRTGWQQILSAPLVLIVAIAALVIPLWQFKGGNTQQQLGHFLDDFADNIVLRQPANGDATTGSSVRKA